MFKPINGYTKQMMVDVIEKEFKGLSIANGNCAYRGLNGTKCAVGCFISDRAYKKDFEGLGLLGIHNYEVFHKREMPLSVDPMRQFQRVHDSMVQLHSRPNEEEAKNRLINWINENVRDV